MRNFKKLLLCFLALAMIVPMIVSCTALLGKGDENKESEQSQEVVETQTDKETETDEHGQVGIIGFRQDHRIPDHAGHCHRHQGI